MTAFMRIIHLAQAVLSGYGALHSYIAVTNLQKYEKTSEKLAEWSKEAANQLHKTRTTQTTAAVAVRLVTYNVKQTPHPKTQTNLPTQILLSAIASLTLALAPTALPPTAAYAASPCLVILVLLARGHVKNYWAPSDGKTVGVKVPLPNMGDYNDAQRATEKVLEALQWIEWSWVGASLGAGMVGY